MYFVADTNVFLAVALNEPEKDQIVRLTSGADAVSPEILPYEIGNALSAMVKRKQITGKNAQTVLRAALSVPVRLVNVNIQQALRLAIEYNIYAYDAYFLQCAVSAALPLITLDKRMRKVAGKLHIPLLE